MERSSTLPSSFKTAPVNIFQVQTLLKKIVGARAEYREVDPDYLVSGTVTSGNITGNNVTLTVEDEQGTGRGHQYVIGLRNMIIREDASGASVVCDDQKVFAGFLRFSFDT